jgi:hypothetical protein
MNYTQHWTKMEDNKYFWHFLNHSLRQLFLTILRPTAKSKRQQHKLFHKKMNNTTYLTAYFGENILEV